MAASNDTTLLPTPSDTLPIVERFVSINGEGLRAGQLSAFIRFAGCSLACSYCDTAWAHDGSAAIEHLSIEEVVDWAFAQSVWNITLTGGEPLEQSLILPLVKRLMCYRDNGRNIEIETNGACDISELHDLRQRLYDDGKAYSDLDITLDWKLPSSGMAHRMIAHNVDLLRHHDILKLVCGTKEDLAYAKKVLSWFPYRKGKLFFSPVFGKMDPAIIVDFLKDNASTLPWARGARVQLQLHKIIWPGVEKGV